VSTAFSSRERFCRLRRENNQRTQHTPGIATIDSVDNTGFYALQHLCSDNWTDSNASRFHSRKTLPGTYRILQHFDQLFVGVNRRHLQGDILVRLAARNQGGGVVSAPGKARLAARPEGKLAMTQRPRRGAAVLARTLLDVGAAGHDAVRPVLDVKVE
jgi:hypothetical protein